MTGPKSPWDPKRLNDERWKNTFSSEGRNDGTKNRSEFKNLYDLCDIKVQRMERINQVQVTIFSRNMIAEKEKDILEALEALKTYCCTKVERMETFRDGQRRPNTNPDSCD
jgi:hypothetical protein